LQRGACIVVYLQQIADDLYIVAIPADATAILVY